MSGRGAVAAAAGASAWFASARHSYVRVILFLEVAAERQVAVRELVLRETDTVHLAVDDALMCKREPAKGRRCVATGSVTQGSACRGAGRHSCGHGREFRRYVGCVLRTNNFGDERRGGLRGREYIARHGVSDAGHGGSMVDKATGAATGRDACLATLHDIPVEAREEAVALDLTAGTAHRVMAMQQDGKH